MPDFLSGFQSVLGMGQMATQQGRLQEEQARTQGILSTEAEKQRSERIQSMVKARETLFKDASFDMLHRYDFDRQLISEFGLKPPTPTQYQESQQLVTDAVEAGSLGDMKKVVNILHQIPWASDQVRAMIEERQKIAAPQGWQDVTAGLGVPPEQVPSVAAAASQKPELLKIIPELPKLKMERDLLSTQVELARPQFEKDQKVASTFSGIAIRKGKDDLAALRKADPTLKEFDQSVDQRTQAVWQETNALDQRLSQLRVMKEKADLGEPLPLGYDAARVQAELAVTEQNLDLKRAEHRWLNEQTPQSFRDYKQAREALQARVEQLRMEVGTKTEQQFTMGTKRSIAQAQAEFGQLPDKEQTRQNAARIAVKVAREHGLPLAPTDEVMKVLKEPGKLKIDFSTTPTTSTASQSQQALIGIATTKAMVHQLYNVVSDKNVGIVGSVRLALQGAEAQITGAAQAVFEDAKRSGSPISKGLFFDKDLSTTQLLSNLLVYTLLASQQGSRSISDKDVYNYQKAFGFDRSLASAADVRNKLDETLKMLDLQEKVHRQVLRQGVPGSAAPDLSKMSIQQLLEQLQQSVGGE